MKRADTIGCLNGGQLWFFSLTSDFPAYASFFIKRRLLINN